MKLKWLLLTIVLSSCGESKKDTYAALEKFDHSLDSLLVEKTFSKPGFLFFREDTLHNNPKRIQEIYYMFIGEDSVKVDANCITFEFKDNQLVMSSGENFMGQKQVSKLIYFDAKMNDELLQQLRSKKSDTMYIGRIYKYNKKGQLIKKVQSTTWNNLQKDSSIVTNDARLLEVYHYKGDSTVTYRREYFNRKYKADSLRDIKTKIFRSLTPGMREEEWKNYTYKFDEFGNWVVKRNRQRGTEVRYRKYYY